MSFKLGGLYHNPQDDTFQCLGCGETLQVPGWAVVSAGSPAVPIRENPENRLLWQELMELDHADCAKFQDAQKSEDHRKYRRPLIQTRKGDDGPIGIRPATRVTPRA